MSKEPRNKYRRFSFLSDWRGIKNALGEMRGIGHPRQPKLNLDRASASVDPTFDEQWFIKTISDRVESHPDNSMEFPFAGERIFEKPLVGFVAGDDPIFAKFKEIIGPHHFAPAEIMAWQAQNNGVNPPPAGELSVVSFVLPISGKTRRENAEENQWCSERWAQTRLRGEIFSQALVRELVALLMGKGILAVSPDVTPMFRKQRYPKVGWASPWSHRHIAYAAGLGTFGKNDLLITEKGCAHRVGSFVVHRKLKPNRPRPEDIHAYCLQYQGTECLKCAKRCPVGAIDIKGHDKETCYGRVAKSLRYCNKNYHIFIYGCGLCSVNVPCEAGIPNK
ncbi:MAG: epoxyqueuosine reductase [bacterium]|nr:epoxyqueuosine reductase [bacterium]